MRDACLGVWCEGCMRRPAKPPASVPQKPVLCGACTGEDALTRLLDDSAKRPSSSRSARGGCTAATESSGNSRLGTPTSRSFGSARARPRSSLNTLGGSNGLASPAPLASDVAPWSAVSNVAGCRRDALSTPSAMARPGTAPSPRSKPGSPRGYGAQQGGRLASASPSRLRSRGMLHSPRVFEEVVPMDQTLQSMTLVGTFALSELSPGRSGRQALYPMVYPFFAKAAKA